MPSDFVSRLSSRSVALRFSILRIRIAKRRPNPIWAASIPGVVVWAVLLVGIWAIGETGLAESPATSSWPQWRGAAQNGVGNPGTDFPVQWNGEKAIRWKVEIPGHGGSTPVIHGQTAFLTSGVDDKNTVLAIDLATGKEQWQVVTGSNSGKKHRKGSGSNPSPVVGLTEQGKAIVVAYFRSGDVAGVSADGKQLWHWNLQDKFGDDTLWWDLGSSPALVDGAVALAVVQTGPSYLLKLDLESGDLIWKQDRDVPAPEEAAQTYSTPLAMNVDGRSVIAMLGADHLTVHDSSDGKMLASLGGFNPDGNKYFRSISSPVAKGDRLVFPYARGTTVTGIDVGKLLAGEKESALIWSRDDLGSDVPTPALLGDTVYVVSDSKKKKGTVTAIGLADGKTRWSVKLPKNRDSFSSSPLVAGNHLYVVREDATTFVIGPLDESSPAIVAENPLPDAELYTVASPVPVDGDLLIRTRSSLYRIGDE